jgi:hypothetical protein
VSMLTREQVVERLKNMAEDGVVDESLLACYDALRAQVEQLEHERDLAQQIARNLAEPAQITEDDIQWANESLTQLDVFKRQLAAKDAEIARLQPTKWTTERPTQPGWYWHKTTNDRSMIFLSILLVYDLENGGPLVAGHEELKPVDQLGGQWAGPIEPPREERDEH